MSLPERVLRGGLAEPGGYGLLPSPLTAPVVACYLFLPRILWAIVYALWIERLLHAPDWLKGVMFSLVPTVFSGPSSFQCSAPARCFSGLDVGQTLAAR